MDIFPCLIVCREASLKAGNHDLHDLMCVFGKDLLAKWHHLLDLVRCPVTNEIILWYPMHEGDISDAGVIDLKCHAQATARLLAHALSKQTGTCRISCSCKLIRVEAFRWTSKDSRFVERTQRERERERLAVHWSMMSENQLKSGQRPGDPLGDNCYSRPTFDLHSSQGTFKGFTTKTSLLFTSRIGNELLQHRPVITHG